MNLEVMQGNNKSFEVDVTDADGNIIDLTGGLLEFFVKDWRGNLLFSKTSVDAAQINIIDALAGQAEIIVLPQDTSQASPGMYVCYINFTNSVGKIYTINQGEFQIMDLGSIMYIRNRIRNYTGDKSELNLLIRSQETTDAEMNDYILKAIENFNTVGYLTDYTLQNYPNLGNLVDGTIIQILYGKSILSARNMLTYQDSGGVSVQDFDTYGRYLNLFNMFISRHHNQILEIKRSINIEGAYGGIESPMSDLT